MVEQAVGNAFRTRVHTSCIQTHIFRFTRYLRKDQGPLRSALCQSYISNLTQSCLFCLPNPIPTNSDIVYSFPLHIAHSIPEFELKIHVETNYGLPPSIISQSEFYGLSFSSSISNVITFTCHSFRTNQQISKGAKEIHT